MRDLLLKPGEEWGREHRQGTYCVLNAWPTGNSLSYIHQRRWFHQAQWLTPVIPALSEAEAGRSQGQEFQTSLASMVKPCL
ncbi:NANOG neighbor homeobox [Plecturocebus cupreus]